MFSIFMILIGFLNLGAAVIQMVFDFGITEPDHIYRLRFDDMFRLGMSVVIGVTLIILGIATLALPKI